MIQRAHWLSTRNKAAGDLIVRCAWPQIMKKLVDSALCGNVAAIKYCAERAWPEEKQQGTSDSSSLSLVELVLLRAEQEEYEKLPSWCREKDVKEAAERKPTAEPPASEGGQG